MPPEVEPEETPAGGRVWLTRGRRMPLMNTTPGFGRGEGKGVKPPEKEAKAAYSAAASWPAGTPATPMTPTSVLPRKTGSPTGFTAPALVSFGVPERSTTLPVTGPVPQPEVLAGGLEASQGPPPIEVARGRNLTPVKPTFKSQPRV